MPPVLKNPQWMSSRDSVARYLETQKVPGESSRGMIGSIGNPPDKPKVREVEFSKKEVLREEVKIYR
jgi:hypothetical protein